eukprot:6213785-Pleurochrysis_carterae.AAC.1
MPVASPQPLASENCYVLGYSNLHTGTGYFRRLLGNVTARRLSIKQNTIPIAYQTCNSKLLGIHACMKNQRILASERNDVKSQPCEFRNILVLCMRSSRVSFPVKAPALETGTTG